VGDSISKVLFIAYLILAGVYCIEANYPKTLYFMSAAGIMASVLWMKT